jgi:threonine synthase
MTLAISKAAEDGAKAVVCASTGNTSASAAAYATRAGLTCAVLIPDGYIALGKLAQALIHGARVLQVRGNFDEALQIVRELGERAPITVVNSVNPYRIEGQKTAAFEIIDTLGDAPDVHLIPVGNAGNITAYWKGYLQYKAAGRSTRLPKMMGFQAAGAAPLVIGEDVEHPETIATAIRIGRPASKYGALAAAAESGGGIHAVTDEEILTAYRLLSASRLRPPRWPGCSSWVCRPGRRWSAFSPVMASRILTSPSARFRCRRQWSRPCLPFAPN